MCVLSGVLDQFQPVIPDAQQIPTPGFIPFDTEPAQTIENLQQIIEALNVSVVAAKTVDRITGQPDCEDSEKEKLLARVALLEAMLLAPPEFIVSKGGLALEAGTYRIVSGKLFKAVNL